MYVSFLVRPGALVANNIPSQVLVEILKEKSIHEEEVATVVEEEGTTWMTPIIEYLKDGTLLGNRKEASKLRINARQYELLEGILYKRPFLKPWVRTAIGSRQGYAAGILLANNATGRSRNDTYMKRLSNTSSRAKKPSTAANPNHGPVASLGEGIKARLGEGNKNQIEELPHVLWAHRTMIKSSHGDTLFSLTYGMKAVIPAEIGMPTYRTATVDNVHNDEELRLNLDLLEEKRERAAIYLETLFIGNDASHAAAGGKLGPKCEGPYEVTEALGDEAYKLRTMAGAELPRTWNISDLKK
ncbi:reverse transcriptase domain-containing protein [Tanacetum coccineum]